MPITEHAARRAGCSIAARLRAGVATSATRSTPRTASWSSTATSSPSNILVTADGERASCSTSASPSCSARTTRRRRPTALGTARDDPGLRRAGADPGRAGHHRDRRLRARRGALRAAHRAAPPSPLDHLRRGARRRSRARVAAPAGQRRAPARRRRTWRASACRSASGATSAGDCAAISTPSSRARSSAHPSAATPPPAELGDDLVRHLEGRPVRARPPSRSYRARALRRAPPRGGGRRGARAAVAGRRPLGRALAGAPRRGRRRANRRPTPAAPSAPRSS